MQPQPEDGYIQIPITFDYKGGRGQNKVSTIISILLIVFFTLGLVVMLTLFKIAILAKVILIPLVLYVSLFILRFFIGKEQYYSNIYENLKASDYLLETSSIWQIFDIDFEYPYTVFFKNGTKGIFVKMKKDVITGKEDTAMYEHYEAISEGYNVAHSLNMDIVHIDYMDNIGNDTRMDALYADLVRVKNPDMQDMMVDIYDNLVADMSINYATHDIYLFLTRDKSERFYSNVESVVATMLGGNFITYRVMDRHEISSTCTALFNLEEFSAINACETALASTRHTGIKLISVEDSEGNVTIYNKTQEELKAERDAQQEKAMDAKKNKQRKKKKVQDESFMDDDFNLFD